MQSTFHFQHQGRAADVGLHACELADSVQDIYVTLPAPPTETLKRVAGSKNKTEIHDEITDMNGVKCRFLKLALIWLVMINMRRGS